MNSQLDAALAYAKRGWFVYPSPAKGGGAHVRWGLGTDDPDARLEDRRATTDAATIRRWWAKWPTALICIDCGRSGLAVIDLDVKPAKDGTSRNGPAALHNLEETHGTIRCPVRQRTPSGGIHLIFAGTIKTTQSVIGEGVDTRGTGGMIVAAPSAGYRMIGGDLEPAELPTWICELATRPRRPAGGYRVNFTNWKGEHVFETYTTRKEAEDRAFILAKVAEAKVEPESLVSFTPLYSDEEFAALLNLIPVETYDNKHDAWLELMLACSHSSTVLNGEDAFMTWTTRDGPGGRIGYASDYDLIQARWNYNAAKCDMIGGLMVGTFNMHVRRAAPNAVLKSPITAADDFDEENEEDKNWKPPKKPAGYTKEEARRAHLDATDAYSDGRPADTPHGAKLREDHWQMIDGVWSRRVYTKKWS